MRLQDLAKMCVLSSPKMTKSDPKNPNLPDFASTLQVAVFCRHTHLLEVKPGWDNPPGSEIPEPSSQSRACTQVKAINTKSEGT